MALKDRHFKEIDGTLFCTIYRQKSIERAGIPVPAIAKAIMDKYRHTPEALSRGKIFPYISNEHFNDCLKIIAGILDISIELDTKKRGFFCKGSESKKRCSA